MRTSKSVLGRIGQYLTLTGAAALPFASGCGYRNVMDDPKFKQELRSMQLGVPEKARKVAELVKKHGFEDFYRYFGITDKDLNYYKFIQVNDSRRLGLEVQVPKNPYTRKGELIIYVKDKLNDGTSFGYSFYDMNLDSLDFYDEEWDRDSWRRENPDSLKCRRRYAKTEEQKKDIEKETVRRYIAILNLALEKLLLEDKAVKCK